MGRWLLDCSALTEDRTDISGRHDLYWTSSVHLGGEQEVNTLAGRCTLLCGPLWRARHS